MSKLFDKIQARGVFRLNIFDKDNNLLDVYTDENLIVDQGRDNISHFLGGSGLSRNITQIGFGENGTAADPADTALSVSAVIKDVDSIAFPGTGTVAYAFTLDYSEGNGLDIMEFGLFTAADALFARKAREVIAKTSDIRLTGTWTLIF